jgi:hypothetical protein
MSINVRVHVTPIIPNDAILSNTPWSFFLTPRWTRDHRNCSFEISESVERNQSIKNWIGLCYIQKILKSKSGSHDDKLCCICVYLALPTRDMTSFKAKCLRISNEKLTFVIWVGRSAHHDHHSLSWHTYIRGPWVQYPIWMNKIPSLQWQCITRMSRYQVRLSSELHLSWFMYSIYTCRVLNNNQVPNFLRKLL